MTGSSHTQAARSVYVELAGPGLASFNFDTRLSGKEDGIGARVGLGAFGIDGVAVLYIPVGVNYIFSHDGRNYFEAGGGITAAITDGSIPYGKHFSTSFGHLLFGYRLQPERKGFIFRIFTGPIFSKGFFLPYYAGISFGYKFRREKKGKK